MEPDRAWGEDTVGLGRQRQEARRDEGPKRPRHGQKRRLPTPVVAGAAVVVALAVLVAFLGGGSDSGSPPVRDVAEPAQPIVRSPRRAEPPHRLTAPKAPDPALKRQPEGPLEQRDREPKASGPAHELAVPEAMEAAPEPTPELEPTPKPSIPTPVGAEFGL